MQVTKAKVEANAINHTAISAWTKGRAWQLAQVSLHITMAKAIVACTINHCANSACEKRQAWQLAQVSLHGTMAKAKVEASTINHTAISAWTKGRAWQLSVRVKRDERQLALTCERWHRWRLLSMQVTKARVEASTINHNASSA